MPLTPLDIQNIEFSKRFRGYDINEVRDYLGQIADEWERLIQENRRLETQLKDTLEQLEYYRNIESLLRETLLSTQKAMNELRKASEEEKISIINKAHNDAREILSKAEEEKAKIEIEIEKLKALSSELKARILSIIESYRRFIEE